MQRFYFKDLESIDDSITIKNKNLINQLSKVIRVVIGDSLSFFNGIDNIDFIFKIVSIEKREIYLEKVENIENLNEIDFNLNIFAALPNKIEKLEYTIKKSVEVGVSGFYFFRSDRSQKLSLSDNKINRLEKIIIEAVEQSGRIRIPELIIEDNINLENFKENQNIFFHTKDNKSKILRNIRFDYNKGINLFIGPEGGFSEEEVNYFETNNFIKAYLGNRILRTETVGSVSSFYIIQNKK